MKNSGKIVSRAFLTRALLVCAAIVQASAHAQSPPNLSELSPDELRSIESACSSAKYLNGPAAYNRCLQNQLDEWSKGPRSPDLSGLSPDELRSIESACSSAKYLNGPAAFNRCLQSQMKSLEGGAPDPSPSPSNAKPEIANAPNPNRPPIEISGAPKKSDDRNLPGSEPTAKGQKAPAAPQPSTQPSAPQPYTNPSTPQQKPIPGSDDYSWLAIIALALFVAWLIKKYRSNRKPQCPRCRRSVESPGAFCPTCDSAIKEESARAEARKADAQRAYQQRLAEERARSEEQRRRAEQQEQEKRRQFRSLEQLQQLTGKEFEDLIASLFRKDGYAVNQCGGSGDEGIDLVLQIPTAKDVVQCKRWRSDVGSPAVREFYGSLMHAGARHGFIITTASFSQSARSFALGKPISLVSGQDIVAWINSSYSARTAAENSERRGSALQSNEVFDAFTVLGLRRGASRAEIHAAYRREMANYHPDKVAHLGRELQELAKRKAQSINQAYSELTREL